MQEEGGDRGGWRQRRVAAEEDGDRGGRWTNGGENEGGENEGGENECGEMR